ncbi:MAG: carbohydrate kinase family protein, partial [Candidatus Altarchaeaceae archaeon]
MTNNEILVTAIGDINIDILTDKIENYPEKDKQIVIENLFIDVGGCAANFAYALSKFNIGVRFIGKISKDIFRNFIIERMKGVDMKIIDDNNNTGITYAINFKDGKRSFITYQGTNKFLTIQDINFNLIEGKFLHIASYFLQNLGKDTLEIFKYAHKKGMKTSFDTGWDPFGWKKEKIEEIREILKEVDVFFPNIDEGRKITNEEDKDKICDKLLNFGVKIVALKMGKDGAYVANEKERIYIEPLKIDECEIKSSTGAGDVFDAAFIYCLLKNFDLKYAGKFA